jgi:hypothetical protein
VTPKSKYEVAPNFGGLTDMRRKRFEDLWRHIRFGIQPSIRPEHLTHAQHRWLLVDQFVENFNQHRSDKFTPSHLMCSQRPSFSIYVYTTTTTINGWSQLDVVIRIRYQQQQWLACLRDDRHSIANICNGN